jgi:hypothetical protein
VDAGIGLGRGGTSSSGARDGGTSGRGATGGTANP